MFDVINQIISRTPKKYFVGLAVASAFVLVPLGVQRGDAAFGPDRPTINYATTPAGTDKVIFNSYTNVPNGVGDERAFATGVAIGTDGQWVDRSKVKAGDEIMMRVWVHNNAAVGLNTAAGQPGVARNTKLRIGMPTTSNTSHQLTAYISADNATPKEVFDTYDIFADSAFSLTYIDDSASFTNMAHPNGIKLDDTNLLTTGSLLGHQQMDGNLPGCFEYSGWVYLKFKVGGGQTDLTSDKKVRKDGQTASTDFKENVAAKPGETVEWRVGIDNQTGATVNNVTILDQIPDLLTIVPGSVKLVNANHPNGFTFGPEAVQANSRQVNVNIGNYTANSNGYILFKTKLDAADKFACGQMTITNSAFTKKDGDAQPKGDTASVTVDNACTQQNPTSKCVSVAVAEVSRTKREFTAKAEVASGATISSYTFVVTDKNGNVVSTQKVNATAAEAKSTFETDQIGTYQVKVTVQTSAGEVTSNECAASFEVKAAVQQPTAECRDIAVSAVAGKERTVRVQVTTAAEGGAKVKSYRYDFGDQTEAMLTDRNAVEHTYARDGDYIVRVRTTFDMNGTEKVDNDDRCTEVVKIRSTTTPPVTPTTTPPTTPPQTPGIIPVTGASGLIGAFAGVSALGAGLHFAASRRRD